MQETTDPRDNIDDIMDNFDFARVRKMMTAVKWHWWGNSEAPTDGELRACARKLLQSAHKDTVRHYESYSAASGGFYAKCYIDEDGKAWFQLMWGEEYSNE